MKTSAYSVWHDLEEQWDPDNIAKPDLQCQARSPVEAAEKLADAGDTSYGDFIVCDEAGVYRQIALVRGWNVKTDRLTTLAALSAP